MNLNKKDQIKSVGGIENEHSFHSRLFRRYMIYNLCFILIPVVMVMSIYFYQTEKQVRKDCLSSYQFAVKQVMRSVDSDISSLNAFAYKLSTDKNITPYRLRHGNYDSVEVIDQIKVYSSYFESYENMYLIVYGDEVMYSGRGTVSFPSVFKSTVSKVPNVYTYEGSWGAAEIKALLLNGDVNSSIPEGGMLMNRASEQCQLIVCPWKSAFGVRIGSVAAIVSCREYQELIEAGSENMDCAMLITDGNRNRVAFVDNGNKITDEQLKNYEEICTEGYTQASDGNWVVASISEINGWHYYMILPKNIIRIMTFSANQLLLISLIVLIFILILIGIWLAYRTYQPIRRLYTRIRDKADRDSAKNELDTIDTYITKMMESSSLFREQLSKSMQSETELSLQRLIAGTLPDNSIEDVCKKLGITGRKCAVSVINIFGGMRLWERNEKVLQPLAKIENVYTTELLYHDYIVLLMTFDEEMMLDERLNRVYAELQGCCGKGFTIGVGNACDDKRLLKDSLKEAIIAIEYGKVDEGMSIVHYASICVLNPTRLMTYAHTLQLDLLEALRARDEEAVSLALDRFKTLAEQQWDEAGLRYLVSLIVFCMRSAAQEVHLSDAAERIKQLEGCSNIGELFNKALNQAQDIMAYGSDSGTTRQNQVNDSILQYVDKNYKSSQLSLGAIADRFDVSSSYLSRVFREINGITFIDYITQKRMAEACRLLRTTDMRIQDVIEEVGYLDVASFSRKFKQIYGVTPGKYRDNFSGSEEDA